MMNKKMMFGLIDFLILVIVAFLLTKSIFALNLIIHIPEKYLEVVAGDRLNFELEIKYPENINRKDLRFTYQIKKGDQVITETKALKAIENQSSFIEYLPIPETVEVGTYTIVNKIQDYEKLNEEVSANFRVIKGKDDLVKYFYILLTVVGIVASLVVIQFFIILQIRKNQT